VYKKIDTTDELMDCPGGVCPVPWATDTSGEDTIDSKAWSTYLDKHYEVFNNNTDDVLSKVPYPEVFPDLLNDMVNHPAHYTEGGIECIEAIEAQLTPEEYRGYLKGNVAKYVWREKKKGGTESLRKAQWYLNRLVALK